MKRYLPVVVFVVVSLLYLGYLFYYGPSEDEPGYTEPTGRVEQPFTRIT